MLDDDPALEKALRSKKTELQAMASVIRNARQHGRHVEPMTHPYDDIFDVLDEDVIRELFPKVPGHVRAREDWQRNRKAHPNRKAYYEERFSVPRDLTTYIYVAGRMRTTGTTNEVLEQLVLELERYALQE